MVQALKTTKYLTYFLLIFTFSLGTIFAQDDPPSRVLRLNYMNGNVSMEPAGVDDWAPAIVNRPFTTGDYLYTDQGSVAELHTDVAAIRLGQYTNAGVLNLTDSLVQLKLTQGDVYVQMHDLYPNDVFEIDTPNAALTLLRGGVYRIHVDSNQNTTFIVTRSGQAEVTGGGQAFTLNPGNSATLSGTDQLAYDVESAPAPDTFDNWCSQRDAHWAHLRSAQYVPQTMIGYEDLDDNGGWSDSQQYGHVWYPNSVPDGWAPYHNGHWAWVAPWGWTWVDDAQWGFAPFHYGRWVYESNRWGWTPGPSYGGGYGGPVVRPCYAPAMVAWFGGAHWGVSLSIGGGGPSVGWVPLGYGEVYTPSYNVSQNYFRQVNVSNTRIVNTTNITNVYNNVYVNKTVYNQTYVNTRAPNAVAAMSQSGFSSGRPVARNATFLRPEQASRVQYAQASLVAPPVAPTRQAFAPSLGRSTVRPPAQLAARQVVAKNTPPPPPPSFAAQQSYLQQHAGQVNNMAALRQQVRAPAPAPLVRQAPAARPVPVQVGQHVGNVQPVRMAQNSAPAQPPLQHGVPPVSQAQKDKNWQMTHPDATAQQRRDYNQTHPVGSPVAAPQGTAPVPTPAPAPARPDVSQAQKDKNWQMTHPDASAQQRRDYNQTHPVGAPVAAQQGTTAPPPARPDESQAQKDKNWQMTHPDATAQQRRDYNQTHPANPPATNGGGHGAPPPSARPDVSQAQKDKDWQMTHPDATAQQRRDYNQTHPANPPAANGGGGHGAPPAGRPDVSQAQKDKDWQMTHPNATPQQRREYDQTHPTKPQ